MEVETARSPPRNFDIVRTDTSRVTARIDSGGIYLGNLSHLTHPRSRMLKRIRIKKSTTPVSFPPPGRDGRWDSQRTMLGGIPSGLCWAGSPADYVGRDSQRTMLGGDPAQHNPLGSPPNIVRWESRPSPLGILPNTVRWESRPT